MSLDVGSSSYLTQSSALFSCFAYLVFGLDAFQRGLLYAGSPMTQWYPFVLLVVSKQARSKKDILVGVSSRGYLDTLAARMIACIMVPYS